MFYILSKITVVNIGMSHGLAAFYGVIPVL